MTDEHTKERAAVLVLLKRGEATLSEAARLADVDRQLVYYWAKAAKIDATDARNRHLTKRWRRLISTGRS